MDSYGYMARLEDKRKDELESISIVREYCKGYFYILYIELMIYLMNFKELRYFQRLTFILSIISRT